MVARLLIFFLLSFFAAAIPAKADQITRLVGLYHSLTPREISEITAGMRQMAASGQYSGDPDKAAAYMVVEGWRKYAQNPALGETPLMLAAELGTPEDVRRLLDQGVDVNGRDAWTDVTALMTAVRKRTDMDLIGQLAQAEKAANGRISAKAFHLAVARHKDVRVMKMMIELGADVNAPTAYGFTPLMMAVIRKDAERVKILIAAGADVNATLDASKNEVPSCSKRLERETPPPGAEIQKRCDDYFLDREFADMMVFWGGADRKSALSLAILDRNDKESAPIAEMLFAAGARVDKQEYFMAPQTVDVFTLSEFAGSPDYERKRRILLKSGKYKQSKDGYYFFP